MKILLITGGSGSENIQYGINFFNSNIPLNLLINGYDDGKSTGLLRKIFKNTLGISDYRKNQILEYKLRYGKNKIYDILNHRFTTKEPYNYMINLINNIDDELLKNFFIDNINYYFNTEESKLIDYDDFSFMNIIYCSLLKKYNNDMKYICNIIKNILNLKNNIFLNSDTNLILKAITSKNIILNDEASIVDFNDKNDKIINIFFNKEETLEQNIDYIPELNKDTEEIILNSDIIIFSCGTQFSSLIPTYKTINFKETLQKSNAKKYLIMNCDYDKDIINYSGNELLNKINEYINLDNINIIISNDMNKDLYPTNTKYNYINIPKLIINNKHNGIILMKYIFNDYYKDYLNKNYIFDYDYTLYDKDNINISIENIKLLQEINNKIIITNNDINNLLNIDNTIIYSNIGNIKHINNEKYILDQSYILNNDDITNIYKIINDINLDNNIKIENRRNISISLKPIFNRDEIFILFNNLLINTNYEAIISGKTTIEILKKNLNKRLTFIRENLLTNEYTYISDKNDINYNKLYDNIKYLEVNDINNTNIFLKTLILNKKKDICIIAGGINERMNIKYPKCLYKINNEIVLKKIIDNIIPYANNIYICGNNRYKQYFIDFEKNINYNNVKFYYFNSIDNNKDYPNGNGETIYQILNLVNLTNKFIIMWSDIIFNNNKIIEEIYNYDMYSNSDILIPVIYEYDPYAYLILNDNNSVNYIEYKKNKSIEYGYHDQCIFLCDKTQISKYISIIINNNNNEINFLNIIKYLNNVNYFITNYPIISYNTLDDIKIL